MTRRASFRSRGCDGFTLIELMLTVAISGVLATLAATRYMTFVERARVIRAVADIKNISATVRGYAVEVGYPPDDLAQVDSDWLVDPWLLGYRYLPLEGAGGPINGFQARRDQFLVPLNTDFDLYSIGRDQLTAKSLALLESRDDVVRANDGGFYGLGSRY